MKKPKEEEPKGFNCSSCNQHHEFSAYVAAHWDIALIHTCNNCEAQHSILRGRARRIKDSP